MREWWQERQMLAALGVKDYDRLDDVLAEAQEIGARAGRPGRARDRTTRSRDIAAFVAAAGM